MEGCCITCESKISHSINGLSSVGCRHQGNHVIYNSSICGVAATSVEQYTCPYTGRAIDCCLDHPIPGSSCAPCIQHSDTCEGTGGIHIMDVVLRNGICSNGIE